MRWASPNTFCLLESPCKQKPPWHPLPPSTPGASLGPISVWPGPSLLSALSHLSAEAIRPLHTIPW